MAGRGYYSAGIAVPDIGVVEVEPYAVACESATVLGNAAAQPRNLGQIGDRRMTNPAP